MCVWSTSKANAVGRFLRARSGSAAVEFALVLPIFLAMLFGALELGNYMNQMSLLEKGLRAGAMYAARSEDLDGGSLTLSSATEDAVAELTARGTLDNSGNFVPPGWSDCGSVPYSSCLTITPLNRTGSENGQNVSITVVKLNASVPYAPLFPGGLPFFGFTTMTLSAHHEQAWIGS